MQITSETLIPLLFAPLSYVAKEDKEGVEAGFSAKTHKIRITLTSSKVKALEKVSNDLVNRAKDKDLRVKGPVRLPTKVLTHTTRKTVSPGVP